MPRVLVADQLPPEGLAILKAATNIELDTRTGLKGDDLKKALAESDAVIVRSATKLKADDLAGQKRLKVIVRAGAGVDTIDLPAATRQGIVVMNTPGGNTLSTAEQTIALLLALARHTAAADASMRAGKWDRSKFVGTQLAGKTIGIVGLGRIGLAVAKRCLAFEMNVVGYDPFMSADRAKSLGIETVSNVEDIYSKVDIITVHVPLSDDTNALVGAKQIAKLKKGSWIINCARGGIVDEAALYDGLKSGHLGGAALDVYKTEPAIELPFVSLPNVVLTPHLGASTNEAQLNVAIEAAELIADFFKTGNVRFAVNMASIDQAELEGVRRHLDIAHRLGLMHAQLAKGPIKKATLRYSGEAAKKKTSLITASFTIGLLGRRLEEQVNLVNAKVKAEERGIQIDESITNEATDFSTLIRTEVETDKGAFVLSGTTRGTQFNRLVRVGPYRIDSVMDGLLLIYTHKDKPGLIGFVGTVFGKHGVNIAQMTVGRKEQGGDAIGVLALDNEPPAAALEEILKDERIVSCEVVKLPAHGEVPNCFN